MVLDSFESDRAEGRVHRAVHRWTAHEENAPGLQHACNLARGDVHDETLAKHMVTVTEVRMSPDLRHATAFIKPLLGG